MVDKFYANKIAQDIYDKFVSFVSKNRGANPAWWVSWDAMLDFERSAFADAVNTILQRETEMLTLELNSRQLPPAPEPCTKNHYEAPEFAFKPREKEKVPCYYCGNHYADRDNVWKNKGEQREKLAFTRDRRVPP